MDLQVWSASHHHIRQRSTVHLQYLELAVSFVTDQAPANNCLPLLGPGSSWPVVNPMRGCHISPAQALYGTPFGVAKPVSKYKQ